MCARDVMTTKVISVGPDASLHDVAQLLLDNRISAAPVINSDGVPIGMVSEGDLIGRGDGDRLSRSDWWLALITGKQQLDEKFQAHLVATDRSAGDVMSAPLVTVAEETSVAEVARLLAIHHIKRVPVIRDGRLVGIVSRADLLRVVAAARPTTAHSHKDEHPGFLAGLFGEHRLPANETVAGNQPPEPTAKPVTNRLAAADFRHLVEDFHGGEARQRDVARRAAAQQRRQRAKELIDVHVFDEGWKDMLHRAREAAESGQKEHMLLRFPNQLCIDGGRAINIAQSDWPATLRGEPAEIYLRWERELKPSGFALSARVMEFPDGKPGDIGLFLIWGE
jgi:CBS domain-containing protein